MFLMNEKKVYSGLFLCYISRALRTFRCVPLGKTARVSQDFEQRAPVGRKVFQPGVPRSDFNERIDARRTPGKRVLRSEVADDQTLLLFQFRLAGYQLLTDESVKNDNLRKPARVDPQCWTRGGLSRMKLLTSSCGGKCAG